MTDPAPDRLADAVVADFVHGRFAAIEARFSPAMREAFPVDGLKSIWWALTTDFGAFASRGESQSSDRDGAVLVVIPIAFERRTIDLKLVFDGEALVGLFHAPHSFPVSDWQSPSYASAESMNELAVAIGPADKPLPGVLTLPVGVAKPPVVILIHGSGPQDRDQSQGPNRPFRDIAVGLAAQGVAALRFDKRTKVYPADMAALVAPTVKEEALDDAAAAVALVAARPEIDARRIVIAGHSLGATMAPRIAAANPAVAGVVMLAAATRPLASSAVAQIEFQMWLSAGPDERQSAALDALSADAARVDAARPGDAGAPFMGVAISYWADLNAHDPAAEAAALEIPVLAMRGGRDYQVGSADFDRLAAALAGRPSAKLTSFPALNHLFMAGAGLAGAQDYETADHVSGEVIDAIARFAASL